MKKWYQQKTFWAGVTIILVSLGENIPYLAQIDVKTIIAGLALIFLREAIESNKE